MSPWRKVFTQIRGRLVTPPPLHLLRRVDEPPREAPPPPPRPPPLTDDEIDAELNSLIDVFKEDTVIPFTWDRLTDTLNAHIRGYRTEIAELEQDLAVLRTRITDFVL